MMYRKFSDKAIDFKLNYVIKDNSNNPTNHTLFSSGSIKFDTGADITIFHASQIGLSHINESSFTKWMQEHEKVNSIKAGHIKKNTLFGFSNNGVDDSAASICSYAYQVSSFDLLLDNGTIHLGSVPITITFDDRFSRPLLGKDLISLLVTKINTDEHRLEIELSKVMTASNRPSIDGVYMMRNNYYNVDNLLYSSALERPKILTRVCQPCKNGFYIEINSTKYFFQMDSIQKDLSGMYFVVVNGKRINLDMRNIR